MDIIQSHNIMSVNIVNTPLIFFLICILFSIIIKQTRPREVKLLLSWTYKLEGGGSSLK